ncbi:MAG TPA: penicillin-binding protein 2, partial [Streptosporangiaceae bacterium]|nr:penicillin-binding protein 2 [Streptosporangiaceae bacterium]
MSRAARWRLAGLSVVCVTLLVVLAVRLWYVQVASGHGYASLASQERVRTVVLPPSRGEILDDVGRPRVASRPSLVVTVNQTALSRQADGGRAELHRLAILLGVKDKFLVDRLRL